VDSFLVHINETVVLLLTTFLSALEIVGKLGSCKIEGVYKSKGNGTSETTRSHVGSEPDHVAIFIFILVEHSLKGVLESEVKSLSREVSQDIGPVAFPESLRAFLGDDSLCAVNNTVVSLVERTLLDHFILVLNSHLDDFNWRSDSLRDGSGSTTCDEVL